MFICCCQSFLVAAVGLWFVGLLLAVHGVVAFSSVASSRMSAVRDVLRMLMVLFMFIVVFINCLYLIQYIGQAHHKRKSPSASFGCLGRYYLVEREIGRRG